MTGVTGAVRLSVGVCDKGLLRSKTGGVECVVGFATAKAVKWLEGVCEAKE